MNVKNMEDVCLSLMKNLIENARQKKSTRRFVQS